MIVGSAVMFSDCGVRFVVAVVAVEEDGASFERLLMMLKWLLSRFAVEYRLFLMSFASILVPSVL